MRPTLVLLHRYLGLVMAGFLAIAGLTGTVLVWYHELDEALSPKLYRVSSPPAEAMPLDPILLRAKVQAAYPDALVSYVPLDPKPGRALIFYLSELSGGKSLEDDEVFVDPYSGRILGARKWGDIGQGIRNLLPFLYRVHASLALDGPGTYVMGFVALLWTLDCLMALVLTFPPTRRRFWSQWMKSWKVRRSNRYKFTFDVHRAGGLWLWAMLFVLAWSSVAFNLQSIYKPVMKTLFASQEEISSPSLAVPLRSPAIAWEEAHLRARILMQRQAVAHRFHIIGEHGLYYDPNTGIYHYIVRTSLDVAERWGTTRLAFSASDGALAGVFRPTGAASGDTITTWLTTLHMAGVWGMPFRILMTTIGSCVAVLAATGVIIWWKKRKSRTLARLERFHKSQTA